MFYTIYKTTNLINGKFYIGKHQTNNLNDGYLGSGKLLKRAIAKYGIDNFHKEILHICKDEKHMNLLESILVVPDPEINYNLCDGGKGGWGYINNSLSEQMRPKRIRNLEKARTSDAIKKGTAHASATMTQNHRLGKIRYDTFTGKSHTDEWKQKQSDIMREKQSGSKNSQYGTCWITNGTVNKKISKSELLSWIAMGFHRGRI
jgi:hypothetical protein